MSRSASSPGLVIWFTGLPRSGKTTLAGSLQRALAERGRSALLLDGDAVRALLVPRPGYAPAERDAFYATLANLAGLLASQGQCVLVAATAHLRRYREHARAQAPQFIEVHLATPVGVCSERDPAGLYTSATARPGLPGVGVPYEPPLSPEVVADGGQDAAALARLVALVPPPSAG